MAVSQASTRVSLHGVEWRIRRDAADDLLPALQRGIESLISGAAILKDKTYRAIYSTTIPVSGRPVIIKHYRNRDLGEALRRSFLSSTAMREWRNAYALIRNGIPTPTPLAVGHKKRGPIVADSWLIMETLPNARSLRDVLETSLDRRAKNMLLSRAAELVRQLHDAGFQHRDLHAKNILVTGNVEDPHLWIVDMHAIVRDRMDELARCEDLARLGVSVPPSCASRSDRLRFFKTYWAGRLRHRRHLKQLLKATWDLSAGLLSHHYHSRTVRCLTNSTLFTVERAAFGTVYRRRDASIEAIGEMLARHRQRIFGGDGVILKNTRNTRLTLVPDAAATGRVCVKEYCWRGRLYRLKDFIRPPPALREWIAARALAVRGIRSLEAIAAVLPPPLSVGRSHYFITKEMAGAVPLHEYAARLAAESDRRHKLEFIRDAADFLTSLYEQQVIHRDLKASNVQVIESNGKRAFALADLAAMRFGPAAIREIARNLAQLNASISLGITSADRLRFLRRYLKRTGLSEREREIAREVIAQTATRNPVWLRRP